MSATELQPLLHDLTTCLSSPIVVLSDRDGQICASGAQGAYCADIRVLNRAELTVKGFDLEPISGSLIGADGAAFIGLIRRAGADSPDPSVWLRRHRVALPHGLTETVELVNLTNSDVEVGIDLLMAADLMDMESVKGGRPGAQARPTVVPGGFSFESAEVSVVITAVDAQIDLRDRDATLQWSLHVPPRGTETLTWSVRVHDTGAVVSAADPAGGFRAPGIQGQDRRLAQVVEQSVADLRALRMTTPSTPDDQFLAAGSPWYLTLFGRDSLWAARMMLPLGVELAAGTLRTLAARQGKVADDLTAEEPGKILHEIRRPVGDSPNSFLPPIYYGTVDATPLWVCLLVDAWRWGMDPEQVRPLLPAAEAALDWMERDGDSDGDGFLEYVDKSGRGLVNQGWKDSGDSVRFADGRLAVGPVALAEVQSYAYEAATGGADLLDAFGRPGGQRWREYAANLKKRFREEFWATDALGDYPVLALDGAKNQVDAPASNMGHLLSSGILTETEAAAVAGRLVHPTMSSGFGLRTMSDATGGYSPLSYHCGSVWPHDTAIAIHGLMKAGFPQEAMTLAEGLLAAATAFGGRLPELYGGFSIDESPVPVPYPASCRPQAWSAASAIVLLQVFLGLEADVPGGTVTIAPAPGIGALRVTGLQIAGNSLDVVVTSDRGAITTRTDAEVLVRLG